MSFTKALIGIMVATIIGLGVTVPVVQDLVDSGNFTGTTALITGFLPLLLVVALIVAVVAIYN